LSESSVINMHKTSMSCHDYEGVMSVLCTPLQVKCYHIICIIISQTCF